MRIADELYTLLEAAGEQGPYVLVGHSVGAHTVRLFVQKYPTDVAGIVLVDPAHEKILTTELIPNPTASKGLYLLRSPWFLAVYSQSRLYHGC
jgi:pimeloyl-ACP methyl ester carboxylesterase